MSILQIIEKKYNNKELTKKEIEYFINGFCDGTIKDYQISSLLMAIRFNGMSENETYYLTKAMIDSGKTLDLSKINGITVDKHSTGGVGDKTSLVVVPLLASLGFKVAKMSGRGLGFTGGTIDKLESISNFKTSLSLDEFYKQVNEIGCSIISQSDNLVLADKLLYALRDVTGTVQSLPLIVSSIMSKKIALGTQMICLDVKAGNGAFFKTRKEASKAAKLMIKIGEKFGVKVKAIVTSMDQPLGYNVGNIMEVKEAIDTLLGQGPKDLENISIEIAQLVLQSTDLYPKGTNYEQIIKEKLISKAAYNKLLEMINAQYGKLPLNKENLHETIITSPYDGYICKIDTLTLGNQLVELGGGRKKKDDIVDPQVGFTIISKINDYIRQGDPLFKVYSRNKLSKEMINIFTKTILVNNKKNDRFKEIYEII